jgi:hypothetical protein
MQYAGEHGKEQASEANYVRKRFMGEKVMFNNALDMQMY